MKNTLATAGRWFLGLVALVVISLPYLGLLFAGSLVLALFFLWQQQHLALVVPFLLVAGKIYAGLAIFTFVFLVTFSYQNCCVGLQSFWTHLLRHQSWQGTFWKSLFWPFAWKALDTKLRRFELVFGDAVVDAFYFWLIGWWRGTELITVDLTDGNVTRELVKPETAVAAIAAAVTEQTANKT